MRHCRTFMTIALVGLLASCGSPEPENAPSAPAAGAATRPKPLSQRDPQAYKAEPSTAMREVPEALRQDIQKAIVCYVGRKRAEGGQVSLDAEAIRRISERLRSGATVEDACQS